VLSLEGTGYSNFSIKIIKALMVPSGLFYFCDHHPTTFTEYK
jgi:hypothetical protein